METGIGKKRQQADWPPSQPGEEFSHCDTFTGPETQGLSADDMLKVAGRVVKGMCAEGQHGNVAQAIKHNHPHGDNATIFSRVQPSIAWLVLSVQSRSQEKKIPKKKVLLKKKIQ